MGSFILLAVLSFAVTVQSECKIHENLSSYYNLSALGKAALDNDVNAVDELLKQGCDVNYNGIVHVTKIGSNNTFVTGLTALYLAVEQDFEELVAKLLTIPGIMIDLISSTGETPLLIAAYMGNANIVRTLHAAGADIFALDSYGYLAINTAAYFGNFDVVVALIELGADKDAVSGFGQMDTPLIAAAAGGNADIVAYLLNIGASTDIKDAYGMTALHYAAGWDHANILRMLHAAGADIFALDMDGYLAINNAALYGNLDAVKTLIELGADKDGVSGFDQMDTPLISSAIGGYADVVAYLLNIEANMDIQDAHGMTALDWAVEYGYKDVEQVLLSRG